MAPVPGRGCRPSVRAVRPSARRARRKPGRRGRGWPTRPAPGPLADLHRRLVRMVTEADIRVAGGRTLHAYDTRADATAGSPAGAGPAVAVFWLHGSPNIGSPPEPLFAAAGEDGPVLVSYAPP